MNEIEIKQELELLVNEYKQIFDSETYEAVMHYIMHDEYEMAFEGLFLEIMQCSEWKGLKSVLFYIKIGQFLGLENESVFDANFWHKLIDWSNKLKV